jgi:hypothetical protein
MLHTTAQERYNKLKAVFARLKSNFNRDDLDDFIQTANSLRDWIRNDATLSQDQKAHLERFVVPESVDWQICNQIANRQKHAGYAKPRTKKNTQAPSLTVKAVQIKQGGTGIRVPVSMRVIGAGEEITIECDGSRESALAFVIRVFQHFHFIFEIAPIPQGQRTPITLAGDILIF